MLSRGVGARRRARSPAKVGIPQTPELRVFGGSLAGTRARPRLGAAAQCHKRPQTPARLTLSASADNGRAGEKKAEAVSASDPAVLTPQFNYLHKSRSLRFRVCCRVAVVIGSAEKSLGTAAAGSTKFPSRLPLRFKLHHRRLSPRHVLSSPHRLRSRRRRPEPRCCPAATISTPSAPSTC